RIRLLLVARPGHEHHLPRTQESRVSGGCRHVNASVAGPRRPGWYDRRLRRLLALAVLALLPACEPAARRLADGPAGAPGASALVQAIAERFGPQDREPEFEALRPKLARGALVPSWVFEDASAWKRSEGASRVVEFTGVPTPAGFRLGVRAEAEEPVAAGQYRGRIRLERIASGRFEWSVREELAVGRVRPAELASALDALFNAAEAATEAEARTAIAAAF